MSEARTELCHGFVGMNEAECNGLVVAVRVLVTIVRDVQA